MTNRTPAEEHDGVVEAAWAGLISAERLTGVQSPPGAGKSSLVRAQAARWAADGRPQLPIVTQTNAQADDLCADLAAELHGTRYSVGRLHGGDYVVDPRLVPAGVTCSKDIAALANCNVVIAPAKKWAYVDGSWEAAVVDEIYQMRSDQLLPLGHLFQRLLVVGDPGQLNPFTTGSEQLFRGRQFNPIESAADTLRTTIPDAQWLTLPVSWRLPPEAANVISDAFYTTPFTAGVPSGLRQLHLPPGPAGELGYRVLSAAAASGWAYVELPVAHLPRTDPEVVDVITSLVDSYVGAGLTCTDESHVTRPLGVGDIAIAVAHRDQRGHVKACVDRTLAERGIAPGSVMVDTANRLQGRQFAITVAWHPLSGRRDASQFHLEAGRLCVMLSRHRHACIVVGRGGIRDQLESHPGSEPIWIGEAPPAVDGWEANLSILDTLEIHRIAA
jgi:hypothetical protein